MTVNFRAFSRLLQVTIFSAAIFLGTMSAASGKIYRWMDERGQLHFSDSSQHIPEGLRSKTKEYKPELSSISITSETATSKLRTPEAAPSPELATDSIAIPFTAKEGLANRVIIDITFNDTVTVPILVDTGSPGLVITDQLADQLGLFDQSNSQLRVLISGIGGQQTATRTIIEKISLGSITEQFIPAHIVSDISEAYQGLIGMDILSSYRLTIDSANQQLIAKQIPAVEELPGKRAKSWWQANFKEFHYYNEYWQDQATLINNSDSPYTRLTSTELKRVKSFIQQQKNQAQELYNQLERFARWNSVPRHWRR